jgi:murein DD-endopeptidase MepM/ murein hydrolase activator NlpD
LPNSQNMALLEASGSPTGQSTTTPATIVADTALVPQSAMLGVDSGSTNDQISLYVVHQGDTLPAVAKMFGVSVNTIIWANDITENKITPGQELVILPISGIEYTVRSGDTLASIAKKYGGDAGEIAQFNDIPSNSSLLAGETIIIPDGEMGVAVSNNSTKSVDDNTNIENGNMGISALDTTGVVSVAPGGTSPLASGALPAPAGSPVVGAKGPTYAVFVGYYERPLLGGVKTQGIHGHNAVDIASSFGTNIMAAADGTIIVAKTGGWNGGYGSYIVISHPNGTQTLYAHLSSIGVSVGENVLQGQSIGKMGETGDATGVHLHFEIRGAPNPF